MFKNLRYTLRTLRQNRGFAATAILSIALAIGANSAIFSLADGIVFRPLPVPNASSVVGVRARTPSGEFGNVSYPDYLEFRDKALSFDGLVAYDLIPAGLARRVEMQPELNMGLLVSGNFFNVLGVSPVLGRGILSKEDAVPGRDAVVVLSHDSWTSLFGSDPAVIGQKILLNGVEFTIVGVAPEGFTVQHLLRPAFYVPAAMAPALAGDALTNRARREFFVKGRLKHGVSISAADADVAAIARTLQESYPSTNRSVGAAVRTERQTRAEFDPGDQELVVLFSVLVVVVLSIACANVANLMLNRGRARTREVAVRLAVGASRRRIVEQLMTESLIIAFVGGAAGLLITQAAVEAFSSIRLPGDLPIQFNFQIDYRVVAFTAVASMASAILFGMGPALQSTRIDLLTALKAGAWNQTRTRLLGRRVLVAVQIAGSLVLVIAAVQLYRGIERAVWSNHGFRFDHRMTMRFAPTDSAYTPARTARFYQELLEKSRSVPGIKSAAIGASLPMTTGLQALFVVPEGYEFPTGQESAQVPVNYVSDGYFETFAIPILAGRGFLPTDRADSPRVAVVNEAFGRRFFKGNPVGKRLRIARNEDWIEIVGVTVTGHYSGPFEGPFSFVYLPVKQQPQQRMTLVAETYNDPAAMAGPLREMVHSIDPNIPISSVRTMEDVFDQRAVKVGHLLVGVVGVLGSMGLMLALVGLYAIVAYQVSLRTREIGIRMALGAAKLQVMKMVLKQSGIMAISGAAIGTVLSIVSSGVLKTGLGPQVVPLNPLWFVATVFALLATTLIAAAVPARTASRIDPQRALRQE